MPFQLVIAEGKEAGREFIFEQASILIGRTSECDVVLYDPGVSRKHARIFSEEQSYFVEDMGSSNGTKVNGAIISRKQLTDGDSIALGPVVFNFTGLNIIPEDVAEVGTRIVPSSDVARRSRGKGSALAPEGAKPDQLQAISRTSTRTIQAITAPKRRSTTGVQALVKRGEEAIEPTNKDEPAPIARRDPVERAANRPKSRAGTKLSAADRARIRRNEAAPVAGFKIFWAEASAAKRTLLSVCFGVFAVGVVGGLGYLAFQNNEPTLGPEPTQLVPNVPVEVSFGLGEAVTYERADQKVFDFEYSSPVKTMVIVHFQSKDISPNELIISVNGNDVGSAPADTLTVAERSNEALVPANYLVRNGKNKIVFDNTKNPPNNETWRVWNIWVEVFPLPELPRDELIKNAQDNMRKGEEFWARRQVGAENSYRAWRSFRESWLTLESIEGSKPVDYSVAREKMKEAQVALDKLCSQLIMEVQSAYQQKQYDEARATLGHINGYFPKKDQPCPLRAENLRDFYSL